MPKAQGKIKASSYTCIAAACSSGQDQMLILQARNELKTELMSKIVIISEIEYSRLKLVGASLCNDPAPTPPSSCCHEVNLSLISAFGFTSLLKP